MVTKKRPSKSRPRRARPARSRTAAPPGSQLGIARTARVHVCQLLAVTLADQHVLLQKTRLCHWNLVGGRFDPLHRMFDEQYESLAKAIDATAERMRMLDGLAPVSLRELRRLARLPEIDGRLIDGTEALRLLLADHEACVVALRADIERCAGLDDVGTADLLTALLREHEKTAWMVRSHLAGAA